MFETETDFFGRLRGLMELFGPFGLFTIIIVASIILVITFWRGVGPILFILFISYSLSGFTQGGMIFLSTMVRWCCLLLLVVAFFKMSSPPKPSMLLFVFYAMLGFLFIVRSGFIFWSLQRAVLLLMVVLCVPAAINSYITEPGKVRSLFKMGIIAAAIWVGTNMLFLKEFIYSSAKRFGGETTIGNVAWAGAYFAPMILWGIIQKRQVFWRIFSILLAVPFVFLIFIGGARTAIFGMLVIASLPMLFLKVKPIKLIGIMLGLGLLVIVCKYLLFALMPDKVTSLTERVLSMATTGRAELWRQALEMCISRAMLFGNGIGSTEIASYSMGHGFHNAYLTIWYNTGFVGLLAILLFLFIYTMRSFRQIRRSLTGEMGEYLQVALGYMLGMIAMSMFEVSIATASGIGVCMLMIITALIDRLTQIGDRYYYDSITQDYYDDITQNDYDNFTQEEEDEFITDGSYLPDESDLGDAHALY